MFKTRYEFERIMVKTAKLAKIIGGIIAIIGVGLFFATLYDLITASFTSLGSFMTPVVIGNIGIIIIGLFIFFLGVYFDHPSHD